MQEIIDLIMDHFKGIIVAWSGTLVNVPAGWKVCDGANGTPDLSGKFIRAASPVVDPHTQGGSASHNHTGESDHRHVHSSGKNLVAGAGYSKYTSTAQNVGNTGTTFTLPIYYALAFIMYVGLE